MLNSKIVEKKLSMLEELLMKTKEVEETAIEIKKDIYVEFLSKAAKGQKGYNISLKDVLEWISIDEYPYTESYQFMKEFDKTYLKSKFVRNMIGTRFLIALGEEDCDADYIYRKNANGLKIPYFSDRGFKKLCLTLKSTKSNLVIEYFLELEKEYLNSLGINKNSFK